MREINASVAGELTPVEIGERIRYRGKHLFIFRKRLMTLCMCGIDRVFTEM